MLGILIRRRPTPQSDVGFVALPLACNALFPHLPARRPAPGHSALTRAYVASRTRPIFRLSNTDCYWRRIFVIALQRCCGKFKRMPKKRSENVSKPVETVRNEVTLTYT
jgi:hypothetical protein